MQLARHARGKFEPMVTHSVLRLDLRLDSLSQDNNVNDGSLVSEHTKTAALRVLRATTPGWRDGDDYGQTDADVPIKTAQGLAGAFSMNALTGGMTNAVFRCSKPGGENQTVLLRSYGKGTEVYFSREAELRAFKRLAARGLGPKLLATFEDGRVEEFLEGQALHAEDMRRPDISILVARRLAGLHAVDLDGVSRTPTIFSTLQDFYQKTVDVCGASHGGVDILDLGRLVARLQERLENGVKSKIVFCHNDLQSGNIMYNKVTPCVTALQPAVRASQAPAGEDSECGKVAAQLPPPPGGPTLILSASPTLPSTAAERLCLIDYEYSGYNPRGFDVGNHFCEWMADYEQAEPHFLTFDSYPGDDDKRRFSRAYLGATLGVPDIDVSPEEVDHLVVEADAYSLASHLMWAFWALLQSKGDAVAPGFDYARYAAERIRAYHHFEGQFLPAAQRPKP